MSTPSPWKFFSMEELSCRHCKRMLMDDIFMKKIVQLRINLGFALPVNSGYRCPEYNNQVSSSGLAGPHTTGHAIDFGVTGEQAFALVKEFIDGGGFTGLGVNQKLGSDPDARFIHVDDLGRTVDRERPFVWSYV